MGIERSATRVFSIGLSQNMHRWISNSVYFHVPMSDKWPRRGLRQSIGENGEIRRHNDVMSGD